MTISVRSAPWTPAASASPLPPSLLDTEGPETDLVFSAVYPPVPLAVPWPTVVFELPAASFGSLAEGAGQGTALTFTVTIPPLSVNLIALSVCSRRERGREGKGKTGRCQPESEVGLRWKQRVLRGG